MHQIMNLEKKNNQSMPRNEKHCFHDFFLIWESNSKSLGKIPKKNIYHSDK